MVTPTTEEQKSWDRRFSADRRNLSLLLELEALTTDVTLAWSHRVYIGRHSPYYPELLLTVS